MSRRIVEIIAFLQLWTLICSYLLVELCWKVVVISEDSGIRLNWVWVHTSLLLAVCAQSLSCVLTLVTPWIVARQAPLSMGFPRQEYWMGLSFPPPGDLSSLGIQLMSPACPALAGRLSTTEPPGKFYQNFKPLWPSISWSLSLEGEGTTRGSFKWLK